MKKKAEKIQLLGLFTIVWIATFAAAHVNGDDVAHVTRYQVKASKLPIVPYEAFDFARDVGKKRNWWRAVNLDGEIVPARHGASERFTVSGVPDTAMLHFAVRSFDDADNRSPMSNVTAAKR